MEYSEANRKREALTFLYHYTSLDSLRGIVENDELWLSHLFFQNDSEEYKYGIQLINEELEEQDDKVKDRSSRIILKALTEGLEILKKRSGFSLSFSEQPDSLSQWRAYANQGVAIGFKKEELIQKGKGMVSLNKCNYDREYQKMKIKDIIFEIIGEYQRKFEINQHSKTEAEREIAKYVVDPVVTDALDDFIMELSDICHTYKHNGFYQEREWRIYTQKPLGSINFLNRATYFKPYTKLEMKGIKDVIDHIYLGPSENPDLVINSIEMFFKNVCFLDIKIFRAQEWKPELNNDPNTMPIILSSIPYRPI